MDLSHKYSMLKEGVFAVPRHVWSDVFDFVLESIKTIKSENKNFYRRSTIKPQTFDLDFSGTSFERLNVMKPKIKVFILNKPKDYNSAYFWSFDQDLKENTIDDHGNIYINAAGPAERILVLNVEHELLHYVQYLIREYREDNNLVNSDHNMGGMPPQKKIPKDISLSGYKKSGKKTKRVKHHTRPIEYYTNLNTILRDTQYKYFTALKIHRKEDNTENRKAFFVNTLKRSNERSDKNSRTIRVLGDIKQFDSKLYQLYLKLLYKGFVNDETKIELETVEDEINKVYDL